MKQEMGINLPHISIHIINGSWRMFLYLYPWKSSLYRALALNAVYSMQFKVCLFQILSRRSDSKHHHRSYPVDGPRILLPPFIKYRSHLKSSNAFWHEIRCIIKMAVSHKATYQRIGTSQCKVNHFIYDILIAPSITRVWRRSCEP